LLAILVLITVTV